MIKQTIDLEEKTFEAKVLLNALQWLEEERRPFKFPSNEPLRSFVNVQEHLFPLIGTKSKSERAKVDELLVRLPYSSASRYRQEEKQQGYVVDNKGLGSNWRCMDILIEILLRSFPNIQVLSFDNLFPWLPRDMIENLPPPNTIGCCRLQEIRFGDDGSFGDSALRDMDNFLQHLYETGHLDHVQISFESSDRCDDGSIAAWKLFQQQSKRQRSPHDWNYFVLPEYQYGIAWINADNVIWDGRSIQEWCRHYQIPYVLRHLPPPAQPLSEQNSSKDFKHFEADSFFLPNNVYDWTQSIRPMLPSQFI